MATVKKGSVILRHVFVDHSNIWGGARLASKIRHPKLDDLSARVSIKHLDVVLGGQKVGTHQKIASGGVPPGMEGVWVQYQKAGYDTQRLFRDEHWRERGVDHSIIGHMWRLLVRDEKAPIELVLASGDGKTNEFGTSFYEVLREVLTHDRFKTWRVKLASFDWDLKEHGKNSPTSTKMRKLVSDSDRGEFLNLFDHYDTIVYHET